MLQLRHKPKPGGHGRQLKVASLTSRVLAFHYRLIGLGLYASVFLTLGRENGLSRNTGCLRHLCPGTILGHFESRSEWTPNELMFLKCFELLRQQKLFNARAWLVSLVGPCHGERALSLLAPGQCLG